MSPHGSPNTASRPYILGPPRESVFTIPTPPPGESTENSEISSRTEPPVNSVPYSHTESSTSTERPQVLRPELPQVSNDVAPPESGRPTTPVGSNLRPPDNTHIPGRASDELTLSPPSLLPPPETDSRRSSRKPKNSILLCIIAYGRPSRWHRISLRQDKQKSTPKNDKQFFNDLKNSYNNKLRTPRQRYFSLRGLKHIAVLEYTENSAPIRAETDLFTESELMLAFNYPDKITTHTTWVDWVYKLKSNPDKKYALEFIEGWKGEKIVILGAIPWLASVLTAILWGSCGGDTQVGIAVASFILAASGSILALLAILSSIDR